MGQCIFNKYFRQSIWHFFPEIKNDYRVICIFNGSPKFYTVYGEAASLQGEENLIMLTKPKKKLWIGVNRKPNEAGYHNTSCASPSIDKIIFDRPNDYQIIEIEVEDE